MNAVCLLCADLGLNKLTVGKIYAGMLIVENWRAYKAGKTAQDGVSNMQVETSSILLA